MDIQNIGSETLDHVWVTDTYPLSTTRNGNWDWWGPWITLTHNAAERQLLFWVEYLGPGWNAHVGYQVDLDGNIIGEKCLTFTNLAEAPVEGDVNPADNMASITSFTGADVYVDKWLSGGHLLPG